MVDFDALEAAGIANARARAPLIEYLDRLGFTAEEMVAAERRGRLFGLAGDVLQWSGPPTYSPRAAAEKIGVSVHDLTRAWTALGLSVPDEIEPLFSEADIDGLTAWAGMKSRYGDDAAMGFLRVLGASMARLAEAGSTMVRVNQPDILMSHTHDELTTARAHRAVGEAIPRIAVLIDAVFRHHTISARTHFERVIRDASASVVCGIGFADLTGFTELTRRLTPFELSNFLADFAGAVADMVHTDGGRVVKFIGDEVMWVSSTARQLVEVALDLVDHPRAREVSLQVRAGLGFGDVLAVGGDYFGTPVNLAARLVTAAAPGQILVSSDVRDQVPELPAVAQEPLTLKGFDAPVTAFDLHGPADR